MAGLTFYGGAKPTTIIGNDVFIQHDPTKTWDDQGVAAELAADIIRDAEQQLNVFIDQLRVGLSQDLATYGAHQVRDGVLDYVSNAFMDVALINGKLMICFDASNEGAQMRACWDLGFLLRRAAAEAANARDAGFHNALVGLHSDIPAQTVGLPREEPPPVPRAQPPAKGGRRVVTSRIARNNTGGT